MFCVSQEVKVKSLAFLLTNMIQFNVITGTTNVSQHSNYGALHILKHVSWNHELSF